MIGKLITWGAKKALNKYIIIGAVTLLLGGGGLMWHNFKQDLRDEGEVLCVQAINEQTVIDLRTALAEERIAREELQKILGATARENDLAKARLRASEDKRKALALMMKEQKENDEEYAQWSGTPLPDGVADRLRQLRTGSGSGPVREDSN